MEKRREQERGRAAGYRARKAEFHVVDGGKPTLRDVTQPEEPEEPAAPVVRIPAAPKKFTSAPDDDELVAQGVALFKRMSWNARVRLLKEINTLREIGPV